VSGLLQDLRYALRQLRKSPGFAAMVVLMLALGIGATAAMFSVVDGALFRSLPYPQADELVSVGVIAPIIEGEFLFAGNYLAWRREQTPFSGFTSSTGVNDCDLTEEHPIRLTCAAVEATFLPTFRIQPILGRNFTAEEDQPGAPRVALLSYGLWQSRFAGDSSVVGRTISLDGKPTRVVGVLPLEFEFPTLARTSVVVPQALDESMVQRNELGPVVRVYGRLKPGLGIEAAVAQMQPLFRNFVAQAPPPFRKELRLQVRPLRDLQIHDSRLAAWLMLGSALTVLLISCANAASLVLARSMARRHELAVRAALGARRIRLFQQRLTESLLLALVGGGAGCGLAWAIVRALVSLAPAGIPRVAEASIDTRVLIVVTLVAIGGGVIFGTAPALEKPVLETLVAATAAGKRSARFRQLLLVGQVALTVVLLAGALLFLRSLHNLQTQPLGMNTQHVVTAQFTLGQQRYARPAQRLAFFEGLERALKQQPGISAVALSDSLPPNTPARTMPFIALQAEGQQPLGADQGIGGVVGWRSVTPEYFSVLGIPLVRGRAFVEEDREPGHNAIILNRALAQRLFPGQDPLGRTIRFHLEEQRFTAPFTVAGVTGNTQNQGLGGHAGPEYYMVRRHAADDVIFRYPDSQRANIVARSALDPQTISRELSEAVASLDPTIPVQANALGQTVRGLAERPRFTTTVLLLFAVMGLLLAAAGVYGLVSLLVSQRTQEMAIHIALGAPPANLARRVVLQASSWIVLGIVGGLLSSLGVARWISALLFGIKPNDPVTLAEAALALLALGASAAYIPARRASKVDPMVALRYE
jgi:putative ABC transport system permease protein